ncbi:5-methyltetrahydropteroyltriglutamate--homocysteine S-methyltransferase [Fundidesulfovibrio butyratiphilus]
MLTHVLGFPRMGRRRELKTAMEGFFAGRVGRQALEDQARALRLAHWEEQRRAGLDLVAVGDFSLYDHMLDTALLLGAAPARFGRAAPGDLDAYYRMARGAGPEYGDQPAMEMTKWFDTNYHYIVPELAPDQAFAPDASALATQAREARAAGHRVKVVLPGPLTFLALAKGDRPGVDPLDLLHRAAEAYGDVLEDLSRVCEWIQLDEPVLATDLRQDLAERFRRTYEELLLRTKRPKLLLATYFGAVDHNAAFYEDLPLNGLHLDLVRAPGQLEALLPHLPPETSLSLGVVDGRNVWRVEADQALAVIGRAMDILGDARVLVASSCSLLHVPFDLEGEDNLAPEVRDWMAFAVQKCREVRCLANLAQGAGDNGWLEDNRRAWRARRASPLANDPAVRTRVRTLTPDMGRRATPYAKRAAIQRERLRLPLLPTTTIGSFPQTAAIRSMRSKQRQGTVSNSQYDAFLAEEIRDVVAKQETLGLDVLVHGEPERNDMVEYFGERLKGFCFTRHGWVQSYGARCVKPPVLHGDVSRPAPMTVKWTSFAQSLTDKPVKGMLTGPVTILRWSFVRDDQPQTETCRQIALAIRDEVLDLEAAGATVIQVDEPALREGLPLRRRDWDQALSAYVDCFRLASSGVGDATQLHTHMCYSEFNEIVDAIAALDADVISIEASRSRMELLEAFRVFRYPNEIGPGVYDIHSPRVPSAREMAELLRLASKVIPAERLWVNPDCGLKTRDWPEALAALANMVEAARTVRAELEACAIADVLEA